MSCAAALFCELLTFGFQILVTRIETGRALVNVNVMLTDEKETDETAFAK